MTEGVGIAEGGSSRSLCFSKAQSTGLAGRYHCGGLDGGGLWVVPWGVGRWWGGRVVVSVVLVRSVGPVFI